MAGTREEDSKSEKIVRNKKKTYKAPFHPGVQVQAPEMWSQLPPF